MNDHDCESVRMAAMAAADGETPLLTPEQIAAHCQHCVSCRESMADSLAAIIPHEAARRQHQIDLWPAIHEKWSAAQPQRAIWTRRLRRRPTWFAGAAALALGLVLAGGVAWRHTHPDRGPHAAQPSGELGDGDEAPRRYEIPWNPPPPLTIPEFRAKYSVYFGPEFQANQAKRIGPDVDVDLLQPVPLSAFDPARSLGTLLIDRAGTVVLALDYPWVGGFREGLAPVATAIGPRREYRGVGFVDRTATLVIPPRYTFAEPFSEGLAGVTLDGKAGFIDRRGTMVIAPKYLSVGPFREGIARVHLAGQVPNAAGMPPDDMQFIDRQGNVLFATRSQGAKNFSEGLMYVNLIGTPGVDQGRAIGYVDRKFSFVFRLGPDSSGFRPLGCEEFHDGMAAVEVEHSNQWGFINREGKLAVPGPFVRVKPFSEGLAAVTSVRTVDALWGYIDHAGKLVIEQKFFEVTSFSEGLAAVLLPLSEPEPAVAASAKPALSAKPSLPKVKWGYIDPQERTVIGPRFYSAKPFHHGLAQVQENPRHIGFIDRTGKYVWELIRPGKEWPE